MQRPRNIFTLGFLFGVGFETASTISLLVLTVSASAAGMCLCDPFDALAVLRMYRSAGGVGRVRDGAERAARVMNGLNLCFNYSVDISYLSATSAPRLGASLKGHHERSPLVKDQS